MSTGVQLVLTSTWVTSGGDVNWGILILSKQTWWNLFAGNFSRIIERAALTALLVPEDQEREFVLVEKYETLDIGLEVVNINKMLIISLHSLLNLVKL